MKSFSMLLSCCANIAAAKKLCLEIWVIITQRRIFKNYFFQSTTAYWKSCLQSKQPMCRKLIFFIRFLTKFASFHWDSSRTYLEFYIFHLTKLIKKALGLTLRILLKKIIFLSQILSFLSAPKKKTIFFICI